MQTLSGSMSYTCLVYGGSIRRGSNTSMLLNTIARACDDRGFAIVNRSFTPATEICQPDPALHREPERSPEVTVRELVSDFDSADVVVLGSPVYHGALSGLLKSGLDHLRWDQFRGKPVGIVVNSGNTVAAMPVCDQLRAVVRTMAGYSTQTQVISGPEDFVVEGDVSQLTSRVTQRIERLADELVDLAIRLRT